MRVAFLHARQDPKYALAMIRSVREHIQNAELIQLTDTKTPALDGCAVIRKPWIENPMIFKMSRLAELDDGPVIVLDTDVIVQHDLSRVFSLGDFDMALTWRDGPIRDEHGNDITKAMPINCGVMFQRNPVFWKWCLEWCYFRELGWYADQLAVAKNWSSFNVLRLHCDNFNYTPRSEDEDVSMRYAVHYKGVNGKKLLDKRLEAELVNL